MGNSPKVQKAMEEVFSELSTMPSEEFHKLIGEQPFYKFLEERAYYLLSENIEESELDINSPEFLRKT